MERFSVTIGEVHHVDVIAHPGAIRRRPVITKHGEFGPAANGHLSDEREQIVGNAIGVFPNPATGMGAYGIEVAQPCNPPAAVAGLDRFRFVAAGRQIGEQRFCGLFAGAVGIDRLDRCGFWNRHLIRVAVKGGATAENHRAAIVLAHRAEQSLRAHNVHIPVAQRLLHRFTDSLESSEVNHRFNRLAERFGACE